MAKKLNEASVLAISNIGLKREGAGSNYTAPKEKLTKQRSQNCKVVERTDSNKTSDHRERQHYAEQMMVLCGNTQIPAVQYKGTVVPRRVLSDFSYLTHSA